jgi:hypothetical protein
VKLTAAQVKAIKEAQKQRNAWVQDARVGRALCRLGLAKMHATWTEKLIRGSFGRWQGGTRKVLCVEFELTAEAMTMVV